MNYILKKSQSVSFSYLKIGLSRAICTVHQQTSVPEQIFKLDRIQVLNESHHWHIFCHF